MQWTRRAAFGLLRRRGLGAVLEWAAIVLWVGACAAGANYLGAGLDGIAAAWKTKRDYYVVFPGTWVWVCCYVAVVVLFYRWLLDRDDSTAWRLDRLVLGRLLNLAYHGVRWPLFFSLAASKSLCLLIVAYYIEAAAGAVALLIAIAYGMVCCARRRGGCCLRAKRTADANLPASAADNG